MSSFISDKKHGHFDRQNKDRESEIHNFKRSTAPFEDSFISSRVYDTINRLPS